MAIQCVSLNRFGINSAEASRTASIQAELEQWMFRPIELPRDLLDRFRYVCDAQTKLELQPKPPSSVMQCCGWYEGYGSKVSG
jgi:hypothetical protein